LAQVNVDLIKCFSGCVANLVSVVSCN